LLPLSPEAIRADSESRFPLRLDQELHVHR
jgi:hypothetical protein